MVIETRRVGVPDNVDTCCDAMQVMAHPGGYAVCMHCGTVHDRVLVQDYRRAFSPEERESRATHEIFMPGSIPRIIVGGKINDRNRWLKLSKINSFKNNRTMDKYESRFSIVSCVLNLPSRVDATARKIFKKAYDDGFFRGRSVDGMIYASIYFGAKVERYPFFIDDCCIGIGDRARMRKCFKLVNIVVNKIFGDAVKKIHDDRVNVFAAMILDAGNRAGMPFDVRCKARDLYIAITKKGYTHHGKKGSTIMGAIYYIVSKSLGIAKGTQGFFASTFGITEVSLRNRAKEIADLVRDVDEFDCFHFNKSNVKKKKNGRRVLEKSIAPVTI